MIRLKPLLKEEATQRFLQSAARNLAKQVEGKKVTRDMLMNRLMSMPLANHLHSIELGKIVDHALHILGVTISIKPFASYLINVAEFEPRKDDDPGDYIGSKEWLYKIPKNSIWSKDTIDEMYDMLENEFGTGEYGGPGQQYSRVSYKVDEQDNHWIVEIVETYAIDI